jgi:hypothetical protein
MIRLALPPTPVKACAFVGTAVRIDKRQAHLLAYADAQTIGQPAPDQDPLPIIRRQPFASDHPGADRIVQRRSDVDAQQL